MQLGSVQQKISCLFVTEVKDEPSSKREHQMYKVLATETLSPLAVSAAIDNALATEKVDGTCCYVTAHKGLPYLWARYDRKPTKQAEKRFRKYIYSKGNSKDFVWNVDDDFKVVPDFWIPAKGVSQSNGKPYPDENGHIPGWVPVENGNKQYCWHSCVVNYTLGVAIVLKPKTEDHGSLEISLVHLSNLLEQTLELIGTNINGNPYGIGNKKNPVHLLVPHGAFLIKDLEALDHKSLMSWFDHSQEGKVEGIVWHCKDRSLFKLHRHHLGLQWPLNSTCLNSKSVSIKLDLCKYEVDSSTLLGQLAKKDTWCYDKLKDILLD
ncbi:RNA ligase 1 isoform X1 [Dendrobates tinctorius]|uniref:RNA ligase 1 isoform X1 n=2 Tax=Dendrobates tinctorius TaxID=92724 RepID=UPI003CC9E2F6